MKNGIISGIRRGYLRLVGWRRRSVPQGVTVMVMAAIIGTVSGIAAWILKWSIGGMCNFFVGYERGAGPYWYVFALPFIGIFLAVAYQRYVVHGSIEHGTEIVGKAIAEGQYKMRRGLCYEPIIASVLTLGFGGSAGAEGPVATVGSAVGSNLARLFGVSPDMVRMMIGCGAGAGIAGIFKAPIGGMMYTLEVMKMKMTTLSVLALVVASLCGALTCYMLTGFSFDVRFLPSSFFDPLSLGWVALLGVFCGFYSIYYNKITDILHRFFASVANRWLRAAAGAAMVGLSLLLFPCMYGEGYGTVTLLMNGETMNFLRGGLLQDAGVSAWAFILLALAVTLVKVFATIGTNSAGGVAGDFAPTIFAGAFCGVAFAWTMNYLFHAELSVGLFALFGMAGAFSGIIHAPLMAVFLVAEMVGNGFGFILPLAVTAAVSYVTVKLFTPGSRYRSANHDDVAALKEMSDSETPQSTK